MRTIEVLRKLDKETKANVYFVGGYVRDLIRRKTPKDVDIVVRNIDFKKLRCFLEKHGKVKKVLISNGKKQIKILIFKANSDNVEAQITLPRGKNNVCRKYNTLKDDASHRDFTINSMYLPIRYKSKRDCIEFFNGRKDIKKRLIRCVGDPSKRIEESPIRMLRAMSLSARTGYKIQDKLTSTIKKKKHLLNSVSKESIREELNEILLSNKPSKYFKLMHKLGVLKIILPELDNCVGVKQDKKYHKYDVFKHCIYTCDNIEKDLVLRLAAVLHDIGKPNTRNKVGDRTTFHRHEIVSVELANGLLHRLKYSNEIIEKVLSLVGLHMYHYTREFKDKSVRRFIKKAGITKSDLNSLGDIPLFKLRIAERLGNGYKTIPVTKRQKDFEDRIIDIFNKSNGLSISDLEINGNDLIKIFKIKQGPEIGKVLNHLLDCILEDPSVNNKHDLIRLSAEMLSKERL